MIKINFIIRYILNLIIENKGKILITFLVILFYSLAGSFEDTENRKKIIKEIEINESNFYITEKEDKYYLTEINDDLLIDNNILIEYEYNDLNILFWILFVLSSFILILSSLDDNDGWNFNYILKETIRDFIRCDEEDNKYNYHIFGKLISRSDRMIYRNEFNLKLKDIKLLPEYNSKSMIRDKKLKIIGL